MKHRTLNPFLRYPLLSLGLTGLALIPLAWSWFHFQVNSETKTLLDGDQRNLSSYEKVMDILREEVVVLISMKCPDVFSAEGMSTIRRVSNAFFGQPGLLDVKSFTHSYKPIRRGLSFEMVPLVSANPDAAELAALRSYALENPLIRNVMVSPDARNTLFLNSYRRELVTPEQQQAFHREFDNILAPFRAEGLEFRVLGLPLVEDEIRTTLRQDILLFLPCAMVLLLVILGITFRSPLIVGLVLVNQAALLLSLPGLVQLLGAELSVFSIMLFPLLTAIHLTLLVHLYSAWQKARQTESGREAVVQATLSEVFKPCSFAALTTAIGLLALGVSDVKQVREFGFLGAAGIVWMYALSFGPGLAILALASRPVSNQARAKAADSRDLANTPRLFRFVERRRIAIAAIALALTLGAGMGISRMRTDVRAVEFLNPSSPTRLAVEEVDELYGGINVVQLEIDSGSANGVNSFPFLKYLAQIEQFAATQPEVSGAYSYAQLLSMMNQIWEQEQPGSFRLPDNPLVLGIFTLALRTYPLPFLAALADEPGRVAYLIVRTQDMSADRYLDVVHRIQDYADQNCPEGVTVSAAKGIHSILEADRRILRSQLRSAGTSLLLIGIALWILWRSWVLAAISLVVNVLPVALVLAAAGFLSIPLNSITIMVAAIGLGIAVDDSVHFITHWREERRTHDARTALVRTLQVKTRPIVSSSLVLLSVFLVFGLSSFPPVVHFGLLTAGAFAGALLTVLLLLPLLLERSQPPSTADPEP